MERVLPARRQNLIRHCWVGREAGERGGVERTVSVAAEPRWAWGEAISSGWASVLRRTGSDHARSQAASAR
jgi:hypothetical protein